MRHGRLAHVAARAKVTGADLDRAGQFADDGQAGRVGQCGQEADVGVGRALLHGGMLSNNIYIDKYQ